MTNIDALGQQIATAAMRTLIRICPETRQASSERLDAACAAMRAASPAVIDQLLANAKEAPWITSVAATDAALTIALAGAEAIRA